MIEMVNTTLGQVGKVRMCKRILKNQTSVHGDVPFYKIGTFGGTPDCYISKELYNDYKSRFSYPKIGNILISASGTIGRLVRYDGEEAYFQDSNIVWIDNDETQVLDDYLYYFYMTKPWIVTTGATIDRLYNSDIEPIKISFPKDINVQKKLVASLKALDSKISLNNSICADLESLAKEIYDYWFVQFDFPNEEGKPYKSSGGAMEWNDELKREIPVGWTNIKFDNIVKQAPKCKSIKAPEYRVRGKYPIVDQASELITGYTDDDSYLYSNDNECVVFGDVTTCFKFINFPFAKGTDGTKIIETIDNRIPASLMFQLIKDTVLPNVGFARHYSFLREIQILLPDKTICELYANKVKPLMDKRKICIEENQKLIKLRDFLLPMLMNGQITFKDDNNKQ